MLTVTLDNNATKLVIVMRRQKYAIKWQVFVNLAAWLGGQPVIVKQVSIEVVVTGMNTKHITILMWQFHLYVLVFGRFGNQTSATSEPMGTSVNWKRQCTDADVVLGKL